MVRASVVMAPRHRAALHSPSSIAIDTLGAVDIADTGNNRIRNVAGLVTVPTAGLSTNSLIFNPQVIGRTSGAQTVTLTNTGPAPMQFANAAITGANSNSFAETNNCPATLAPQADCTINVTFTPATSNSGNPLTANLSISDSAPGSPQLVSLTGTGVSAVSLAPPGLSFPLQINTTTSASQSITVTNNQTVTLNIASIAISGSNAISFAQVNSCGAALTAGSSCVITVTFTPNTTGSNTAVITITDDAPGGSQTATLFGLGTGATATFSPTSLTFSTTQAVSTTSAAQVVTLTNNGKETLNISNIGFSGTNNGDFGQTTTCGATLAPGANCPISVTFTPTGGGTRTAQLTLNDSAGDSPQTMNLIGTGIDFQVVIPSGGFTSQTVTAGASTIYNIEVDAIGGAASTDSIKVTLTCGNIPLGATCTLPNSSVTVTPTTSAQVSFTVTTTAAPALAPPNRWFRLGPPARLLLAFYVVAMLAILSMYRWKQRYSSAFQGRRGKLAGAMLLVTLMVGTAGMISSCSPNTAVSSNGGTGTTAAGIYMLNITGTENTDSHTVQVTLIVQ